MIVASAGLFSVMLIVSGVVPALPSATPLSPAKTSAVSSSRIVPVAVPSRIVELPVLFVSVTVSV